MTPAAPAAVQLDADGVGRVLSVSRTSIFGMLAAGRLPPPVLRCGRIVRWSAAELAWWVEARCPPADAWRVIRGGR